MMFMSGISSVGVLGGVAVRCRLAQQLPCCAVSLKSLDTPRVSGSMSNLDMVLINTALALMAVRCPVDPK